MSYTTRCPACGTMFKVVPDQLKISDGWVRCGHCADVFDATLHLETWVPPAKPATPPAPSPPPPQPPAELAATPPAPSPGPADAAFNAGDHGRPPATPLGVQKRGITADPAATEGQPAAVRGTVLSRTPAPVVPAPATAAVRPATPPPEALPDRLPATASVPEAAAPAAAEAIEADFLSELQRFAAKVSADSPAKEVAEPPVRDLPVRLPRVGRARSPVGAPPPTPVRATEPLDQSAPVTPSLGAGDPVPAASETSADPVQSEALPPAPAVLAETKTPALESALAELEFVQRARRKAYWQTPAMRALLTSIALVLALALVGQWSFHERNRLVAWKPGLQPVFENACDVLGCALTPVQSIDDIVIDSSALVRRLGNLYSFDLVLKNSAAIPIAVPALELTLTDAADNVISRRVFLPQDMPGAPQLLAAEGSMSVSLRLSIAVGDNLPMSGYRALVFYP